MSATLRSRSVILFLTLLFCYVYFPPRWADWNQNSRFDLVLAIVDDGVVHIDRYVANTGDYAFYGGHYYSDKAPGMAFLGVPVYAAFRAIAPPSLVSNVRASAEVSTSLAPTLRAGGTGLEPQKLWFFIGLTVTAFVTVAIPSAALGVLVFRMAASLGCGEGLSLAAALLFALGTIAFPYSNTFVGHQTSAFLLFAAFALLRAVARGRVGMWGVSLSGFLIGYAAITEYPTVLVGVVLSSYALLSVRNRGAVLARLIVGAAAPLLLLAAYDYAAFGTPLPVGYAHSTLWTDVHSTGFLSLTYPRADALWGITFGSHRGLFFLSPFLLFALPGYVTLWRGRVRRVETLVLLLAPALFFVFNASSAMWQGGFAVGPRYLIPSLPFLAMASAAGIGWAWRCRRLRPLVVATAVWSVFAVWAETIGGQSFPDYTPNPLFDLSLPRLIGGDVARNLGHAIGLSGLTSVVPLIVVLLLGLALAASGWGWRKTGAVPARSRENGMELAPR